MKLQTVFQLSNMVTGVWSGFGVHLFEGRMTVADIGLLEAQAISWRKHHPGKAVEQTIIFPSDAGLTAEERSRMARLVKHGEKHRTASATVVLATGVLGTMHRSILVGLLMRRLPTPQRSSVQRMRL